MTSWSYWPVLGVHRGLQRPRQPVAGVSAPLTWTEVHEGVAAGLRPHDFTLRSIFGRLERVGDLWAALRTSAPARLEAAFAYEE